MHKDNLLCRRKRPFAPTTLSRHGMVGMSCRTSRAVCDLPTSTSSGNKEFLGRNKELNRRLSDFRRNQGRTFSALPDRTGGPKGPNVPAGNLQMTS
jgi:hypothetical protein